MDPPRPSIGMLHSLVALFAAKTKADATLGRISPMAMGRTPPPGLAGPTSRHAAAVGATSLFARSAMTLARKARVPGAEFFRALYPSRYLRCFETPFFLVESFHVAVSSVPHRFRLTLATSHVRSVFCRGDAADALIFKPVARV